MAGSIKVINTRKKNGTLKWKKDAPGRKILSDIWKGRRAWNKLPTENRKCFCCGNDFQVSIHSKKKYCSYKCYWYTPERYCANCGIILKRGQSKFCSNKCHAKFEDLGHKYGFKKGSMFDNYGYKKATDIIIKRANTLKEKWRTDKEYARKVMSRRPMSKPEKEFQKIIEEYDLPYIFTGNVSNKVVVIGGKIPDFTHNTDKKVIEIWGDFFHKGQNPENRINYFKKFDYNCLVLWASEISRNRDEVLYKVNNF